MKKRESLQEQLVKIKKASELQKITSDQTVQPTLSATLSSKHRVYRDQISSENLIADLEKIKNENEILRQRQCSLIESYNIELTKLKEQCKDLSIQIQAAKDLENILMTENQRLKSEIELGRKEVFSFWRIRELDMSDRPNEVAPLTSKAKRALVLYELRRSGKMPNFTFELKSSKKYLPLDNIILEKIESQREHRWSELRWWVSAAKFLEGHEKEGTEFEKYKKKILKEIEPLVQLETKRAIVRRKLDERIHTTSSYWDRVDEGLWREQA